MMNIVLMMKNKPSCHLVYQWCKNHLFNVTLVAPDNFHKSAITYNDLVKKIDGGFEPDLVVSFLYHKKIKEPILSCAKYGCINFHPAPLPEYKGYAPYVAGIIDGVEIWGVTAHYMDSNIDTGDIIKVNRFEINKDDCTSASLSSESNSRLVDLFIEIMRMFKDGREIPRRNQDGGNYTSLNDFENLRRINENDNKTIIDRKTRAFWCPPHEGAYYILNGYKIISIPRNALTRLGARYE